MTKPTGLTDLEIASAAKMQLGYMAQKFSLYGLLNVSLRAPDSFGRLLGVGLVLAISIQGLVNLAVAPESLENKARALAEKIARFDRVALAHSKRALDEIPAQTGEWEAAFAFGAGTNDAIRESSGHVDDALAKFVDGGRNPGQGS